ncbi:hypothetical protein [Massilia sp. CT11-137]|uniref:hypothetical protein n=1 Tax=Massilia sp. CT11-137 TaxID=3393901 RepID=UPI0039B08EDD
MAFGLYNESSTAQELADERFLARVQGFFGRPLTFEEEEIAFSVRDQGGYTAAEAAVEVLACAAEA